MWLVRLLCVYKFPWVVLLPRNSNSWQGFLQIGDRGKPADGWTLQFALSFWLRQHLAAQTCRRPCKCKISHRSSNVASTPNPIPGTMRLLLQGNHFCRCPLETPRTKGPHKKYFKMPETKIKLQCCGDTSVLTVAKYAISLKQWRNEGGGRNVLWFIYLFPVAVENFLQAKGRPETDPICQLWISINNEHNSLRVFK